MHGFEFAREVFFLVGQSLHVCLNLNLLCPDLLKVSFDLLQQVTLRKQLLLESSNSFHALLHLTLSCLFLLLNLRETGVLVGLTVDVSLGKFKKSLVFLSKVVPLVNFLLKLALKVLNLRL